MAQRIVLQNIQKPVQKRLDEDVIWVCDSLGFRTGRDLEAITPKTVLLLLENLRKRPGVPTEMLAEELAISIGRVNYHIRSLVEAGFLRRERRLIHLRAGSVKAAVEEMRKDANRIFDELSAVAEEIDARMGFRSRD
ncbi:ArsR family transcriptional regulator [Candidatus Woesearchaeota archaeon]|nr:MAG: ArsR family transcriptional regulator [Candidatus Woesearchaeota archaeon]